jgi:hypothetical protein
MDEAVDYDWDFMVVAVVQVEPCVVLALVQDAIGSRLQIAGFRYHYCNQQRQLFSGSELSESGELANLSRMP